MKKQISLIIFLIIGIFVSCNKITDINNEINKELIPGAVIKDGALHIDSKDFISVAKELANMSDIEYEELVKLVGFESYRVIYNYEVSIYEEKYNRLIDEGNVNSNELQIPLAKINSVLYQSIANANGEFYVDGVKNVVDETTITGYQISSTKSAKEIMIGKTSYLAEPLTKVDRTKQSTTILECATRQASAVVSKIYGGYYNPYEYNYIYVLEITTDGMKRRKESSNWRHYSTAYSLKNIIVDGVNCGGNEIPSSSLGVTVLEFSRNKFSSRQDFIWATVSFQFATTGTIQHGYGNYIHTTMDQIFVRRLPDFHVCE